MSGGVVDADQAHGGRPLPARGHLAAVADDLLPAIDDVEAQATTGDTAILVAAPGRADTRDVMAALGERPSVVSRYDLGSKAAELLDRWEQDRRLAHHARHHTLLLWCLAGEEATALGCALALGRIGAVLKPRRVSLLWFAERVQPAGTIPAAIQCEQALALAGAAVPVAAVNLHCLGWLGEAGYELRRLLRRFG